MIADVTNTSAALATLGVPGLVVALLAMVAALGIVYRSSVNKDKIIFDIQESRLSDAKETRDKIGESMQQQALLTKQIYDIVISNTGRKR